MRLYAGSIGDCRAANTVRSVLENATERDEAAIRLAKQRGIGAWVIVMRIFPAAILRDYGGTDSDSKQSRTAREMHAHKDSVSYLGVDCIEWLLTSCWDRLACGPDTSSHGQYTALDAQPTFFI